MKNDFGPEKYLDLVKCTEARKSLNRLYRDNYVLNVILFYHNSKFFQKKRLSVYNLYIERDKYETPLVPKADYWCVYRKLNLGDVATEDEFQTLAQCPLYTRVRNKFKFHPKDPSELAVLLSNQNLTAVQATSIAKISACNSNNKLALH